MDPNASLQQYPSWYLIDSMYRSYPSPAPSDPSPAPRPPPQLDPYPMPSADFSQIPSSIGPARVARRQPSDQKPAIHRRDSPPSYQVRHASFSLSPPLIPSQMPNPRADTPYSPYPGPSQPVYSYAHRSRQRSDSSYDQRGPSPAPSSTSHQSDSTKSRHPLKHTKHRLRDADRKNICLYHLSHPHARQEDIGAVFGVERSTISKILKEKDKWLNLTEEESNDPLSKHR